MAENGATNARDGRNVIEVPVIFVNEVRELLSDDEESNELFEGTEFSDQRLAKHLVAVVQDWNLTPPVLDVDLTVAFLLANDGDLRQIRMWVIEATVARALRFGAIRGARNQMAYQAGSVTFDPNQNWQNYISLANQMWEEWERRKRDKKVSLNIEGGYHVAHTDLLVREVFEHGGIISVVGGSIS